MFKLLQNIYQSIINIGIDASHSPTMQRAIATVNKGTIIAFICGLFSSLYFNISLGNPYKWLNIIAVSGYLLSPLFNYLKWHNAAKINLWMVSCFIFFWMASTFGYESNAHLLFIIVIFSTLFNYSTRDDLHLAAIITTTALVLIAILFMTNFSLLKIDNFSPEKQHIMGIFNFFICIVASLVIILFYLRENTIKTDTIKDSEYEIRVQYEELQKANKELDLLVYSVTHDLRAPITSSIALVDICRNHPEQLDFYLNLQEQSLLKLDKFITDILYYYRNSRLEIKAQYINFDKLITDIYSLQDVHRDGIVIEKTLELEENVHFYSDELRLNIIFNNLISNAIRYADLSSGQPYVHIKIQTDAEKAIIQVIDNGVGIHDAHQSQIFNMFYRANKHSQGSGLGLYIVKEAINKLNGTISVSSQAGVGTTFTMIIPNLPVKIKNNNKQMPKEVSMNL